MENNRNTTTNYCLFLARTQTQEWDRLDVKITYVMSEKQDLLVSISCHDFLWLEVEGSYFLGYCNYII